MPTYIFQTIEKINSLIYNKIVKNKELIFMYLNNLLDYGNSIYDLRGKFNSLKREQLKRANLNKYFFAKFF